MTYKISSIIDYAYIVNVQRDVGSRLIRRIRVWASKYVKTALIALGNLLLAASLALFIEAANKNQLVLWLIPVITLALAISVFGCAYDREQKEMLKRGQKNSLS
jgi:hypothetical protein